MKTYIIAAAALLAAAPLAAQPQQNGPKPIDQDPPAVAARIDRHLRQLVPFGYSGSVLIAKDGRIVHAAGYGLADREAGVPVTAETVFDIGSITKQFTAAAILRLEMEGRLSVNDPVSRWFANVPADKQGMTLHHLLTHSSGLRDGFGGDYEVAERDSLAGVILGSELLWTPGTRYRYSNAGYSLLGAVVEKASGMGYEQYLREKLWAPAGMTRTGYRGVDWRPGELSVGYRAGGVRDGTSVEQRWAADGPWWNLRANGGVLSTVTDLFRWHQALEGESILNAEARRKLWTPHVPEDEEGSSHYGYGWAIQQTVRGTKLIAHNGGNGIFFADFRRYVDEGVVILVMSNTSDASASGILQPVGRMIFGGGEIAAPPATVPGDAARAAAVAGTYTLPSGGTVTVSADGVRLRLTGSGPDGYALARGGVATPRMQELSARSVALLQAAARGDYVPLHQALNGPRSVEELRIVHEEFMGGVAERLGPLQAIEAVGTAPQGEFLASVVRMRMERGEQLMRLVWEDGTVIGLSPLRDAPTAFVPAAEDAWVSYDMRSGATMHVRFEGGALVVETPAGPVRATRAG